MFFISFQKIIPQKFFTSLLGKLANYPFPKVWLIKAIKLFMNRYPVNLNEFDFDLNQVKTFNQFFARRFKTGLRLFNDRICSPAEGTISEYGLINQDTLCQVKGKCFRINDLMNRNSEGIYKSYLTIYLSPADYHRVHAPFDMQVETITHIPGTLYSVNKKTSENIDRLYCRNERVVFEGSSVYGRVAIVMVGALGVGSIKVTFCPEIFIKRSLFSKKRFEKSLLVKQGEEMGVFCMGSTVILIMEDEGLKGIIKRKGTKINLGESLVNEFINMPK